MHFSFKGFHFYKSQGFKSLIENLFLILQRDKSHMLNRQSNLESKSWKIAVSPGWTCLKAACLWKGLILQQDLFLNLILFLDPLFCHYIWGHSIPHVSKEDVVQKLAFFTSIMKENSSSLLKMDLSNFWKLQYSER